jgi:hypothetical protein
MGLFKLDSTDNNKLSVLKDPFIAKQITGIHIHFSRWRDQGSWRSSIEFQNGNTEGTQKFEVEGDDGLIPIITQMEEFIKSLK